MPRPMGIKGHVQLASNLWVRFMSGKLDCPVFDDDSALDYAVTMRLLLARYDSTGLIGQLFSGAIDQEDWRKEYWWRRARAFDDMCAIRLALHTGGYLIACNGRRDDYRCQRCKVW